MTLLWMRPGHLELIGSLLVWCWDDTREPIDPAANGFPPPTDPVQADWRADPLMLPPDDRVVFGVDPVVGTRQDFDAQWGAPTRMTRVYSGRSPGVENSVSYITSGCQDLLNAGVVPVADWNFAPGLGNAGFNVAAMPTGQSLWAWVAAGNFLEDGVGPTGKPYKGIRSTAAAIRALTKGAAPTNRIMFSICHEMGSITEGGGDGTNRAGTPQEFAAAHRKVWQTFADLGVRNVLWLFNFAGSTANLGTALTNDGSDGFYPGHRFVDAVGWDPYNSAGVRDNVWRSFRGIHDKFGQLAWWRSNFTIGGGPLKVGTAGVYKPVMLPEFGTTDSYTSPTTGAVNDASTWFDDMISAFADPQLRGIIRWVLYFNNAGSLMGVLDPVRSPYRIEGTTGRGRNPLWATTPNQ